MFGFGRYPGVCDRGIARGAYSRYGGVLLWYLGYFDPSTEGGFWFSSVFWPEPGEGETCSFCLLMRGEEGTVEILIDYIKV